MSESLTREVSGGFIRGFCENGIEKFLGIPFGKIKRFESPEKFVGDWPRENPYDCFVSYNYPQNIENCKRSNALIPKYNDFDTIKFSEENELRLCVYSPKGINIRNFLIFFQNSGKTGLPVMVYIHGGSYINGGPAEYPGNDEFVTRGNVDSSF